VPSFYPTSSIILFSYFFMLSPIKTMETPATMQI
jgi:hypothetical protein